MSRAGALREMISVVPAPAQFPALLITGARHGLGGPVTDVLVRDGRVAAVGVAAGTGDAKSDRSPDVEIVDGRGGTLLPGLRDQHVHMDQWSIGLQRVDLAGVGSAAEAAAVAASAAQDGADVVWGKNFRDGLWPDAPHRELLDAVAPGRAVALVSNDLHCVWLSSAALALIGVDHPTGLLREEASFDALRRLPQPDPATVDRWVRAAAERAAARGVTRIQDFEFIDTRAAWRRRAAAGPLPLRVTAAIYRPLLGSVIADGIREGDIVGDTDGLVTVGPCKVLIDGSLNTRTAYCTAPYPGGHGHGMLTEDLSVLTDQMRNAAAHGVSFAVHAIGDAANRLALDCFADAGCGGRIEHAQLVDPVDAPRFPALGVIASVQPGHAPEDRDVTDVHWRDRADRAFPYRTLLDAGAVLEFGSDAPVSRLDPWFAIAAAVHRTVDDREPWHPEQRLTLAEAIRASTGGALAPQVGAVADLVLTDLDPATADRGQLATMPVRLTTVGGRITHRQ